LIQSQGSCYLNQDTLIVMSNLDQLDSQHFF
jgi:hypothetical protein